MFSTLLLITLAQAPLGIGQVPTTSLPSFPPASYIQHIFFDQTTKCLMHTHGGTSWRCLAEEGYVDAAVSTAVAPLASTSYVGSSISTAIAALPAVPTRVAWSASLDFGLITAGSCDDITFTATGAVANEAVACGGLAALALSDAGMYGMCGVSATNTGFVRACCQRLLASCGNPAAITFSLTAMRP